MRQPYHSDGYIALITVLLVSVGILIVGMSVALMHADEVLAAYSWLHTTSSRNITDACVDNALSRLSNNTSLAGNVNLSTSNVNCDAILTVSGNISTIIANATSTDAFGQTTVSRVQENVNTNTDPFTVTYYKDILD